MLNHLRLQFRWWIEFFAWVGLAGLFVVVQFLPIPEDKRVASDIGLLVLGLYAFVCIHLLFPRWNFTPRIIHLTLVVDFFLIGLFRFLLAPYLPDVELGFIPIILMAALVADRRGVMALTVTAILVDLVPRLAVEPRPELPGIASVICFEPGTWASSGARSTNLGGKHLLCPDELTGALENHIVVSTFACRHPTGVGG